MYIATIISPEKLIIKNKKGYQVHFDGWPSCEDKDVMTDDIMEINEEALEIKKQIESLDPEHNPDGGNSSCRQIKTAAPEKNEKILAYYSGQMYSAKIVDIDDEKENNKPYLISYHGWGKKANEWVAKANLLKMTPTAVKIKNHLKKLADGSKQKADKRKSEKMEKQRKMKLTPETGDKDILEEHNDPVDDWLTKNLFSKKPKEVTKKSDAPQPTCIDSEVDNIEVSTSLSKYASKRSILKKIEQLEKQVDEYRSVQEYNFCIRCKRQFDTYKKEK